MNSLKLIFGLFLALNLSLSYSQQTSISILDLGLKESSILAQKNNIYAQNDYKTKLRNALIKFEGLVIDPNSDYMLISDIRIISLNQSSAGMMPVSIFRFQLTLDIIKKIDKKIFGSVSFDQEIRTNTDADGLEIFIKNLDLQNEKFGNFIRNSSAKIETYYSENCSELIKNIRKYESAAQLEKALLFCSYVPANAPCFDEVDTLARAIYSSICYTNDYRIFLAAQESIIKERYHDAIDGLKTISVNSDFHDLSVKAIESVSNFLKAKKLLEAELKINQKELEIKNTELQIEEKKRIIQEGINQTNIELTRIKTEAEKAIKSEQIAAQRDVRIKDIDAQIKIQDSKAKERENELRTQLRQDELSLQRKQTEVELANARRRENYMQAYLMQQSMSQTVNLTIVR